MYTWLSRVMTFVFLLNVLSPAYAQQDTSARHRTRPPLLNDQVVQAQNEANLAQKVADYTWEARQAYLAQITPILEDARTKFLASKTFEEMDAAYKEMQQIRNDGAAGLMNYRDKFISSQTAVYDAYSREQMVYYQQNPHVAPDAVSQTVRYDARLGYDPKKHADLAFNQERVLGEYSRNCFFSDYFLQKLQNNEFNNFEEMVDFLDPIGFTCSVVDNLAVAYAAETLYYGLEGFMHPDSIPQKDREEMAVFFAHLRYRALEALKRLNATPKVADENLYLARGSVRILLAILPRIVTANNLQLPEKKLYLISPTEKNWKQVCSFSLPKVQFPAGEMNTSISVSKRFQTKFCKSYAQYTEEFSFVEESLSPDINKAVSEGIIKVEEITASAVASNPALAKYVEHLQETRSLLDAADGGSFAFLKPNMTAELSEQFYRDFAELKNKKPGSDSKEMTLLKLVVQYAAQYAVLMGDENLLSRMLAGLEGKPNSDFKTNNSEAIATLFNSVYETLRGFNVADTWNASFDFLMDAAQDSHAPGTRVLALSTLGMLNQKTDSLGDSYRRAQFTAPDMDAPTGQIVAMQPAAQEGNAETEISANPPAQQEQPAGDTVNKYWLSAADRFSLGQSVADLYGPLNGSHYGMKDYGLNSKEMLAFADELAGLYMQFLPLEAPTVTLGRCGRIEKVDTENRHILTVAEFLQTEQGVIRDADCQFYYTNGGVFVFGLKGIVEMSQLNFRNAYKYKQEITNKGMELLGEAIMWLIGGAVVGIAFRGMRLLYGVSKGLPRAIRAGQVIYKGTKGARMYRWSAAVKRAQGSMKVWTKYSTKPNFTSYLSKNGMSIVTETPKPGTPGLVPAGAFGPVSPSPVTRVTATAADVTGLSRQANFVMPSYFANLPPALQRAHLLRTAQQYGLRNVWTATDRHLFRHSIMWRNAHEKLWNDLAGGKLVDPTKPFAFPEGVTLPYYPGSVVSEHPLLKGMWQGYMSTLKFFGMWKLGDVAVGIVSRDPFNRWMVQKQEEAALAEMKKYPSLSDENLAKLAEASPNEPAAAPGDLMDRVGGTPKQGLSWLEALAFPSWVWNSLVPSQDDATDGSMFLPVWMSARYAWLGDDAFLNDAFKSQTAINAQRMQLISARADNTKKMLGKTAESWLEAIEMQRAEVKKTIAVFTQYDPGFNWQKDMQAISALLDSTEKALQDIQKEANLATRSQRLQSLSEQFEAELVSRWNNLNNNSINSQIDQLISQYALAKQLVLGQMLLSGKVPSAVLTKGNQLYTALIEKLNKIKAERFLSGEEKNKAVEKCIQEFKDAWASDELLNSQLDAIYNAEYGSEETGWNQNGSESTWPDQGDSSYYDNEELYPDEDPEASFQAY